MITRKLGVGPGIVAVFALMLLAGCDGQVDAPGSAPSPTAADQPASASPEETSTGNGVAISKSDVVGVPDSPISSGDVLLFPGQYASRVGDLGGVDLSDPGHSRHAQFRVSEADLTGFNADVARIGDEGEFTVDVAGGDFVVCLANTYPSHTPGPPYSVIGCDRAEINGEGSLRVTHGEGGVQASQE